METVTTDTHTRLEAAPGKYLTQAAPTNFHKFYTSKTLSAGESASDFREVTATERRNLEKADKAWTRPPQWLIDQFNGWAYVKGTRYGQYNETTGFFELNGLTDIGREEAEAIVAHAPRTRLTFSTDTYDIGTFCYGEYSSRCTRTGVGPRTYMPYYLSNLGGATGNGSHRFSYCNSLLVLVFASVSWRTKVRMFENCTNLRIIRNFNFNHDASVERVKETFFNCTALEMAELTNVDTSFSLQWSPKLSIDCLRFIVAHRRPNTTRDITITVHPDVYARIPDDLIEEAATGKLRITFAKPQ